MSTLLIDIGNSRIKWARLARSGRLGPQRAARYAGWSAQQARHALFGRARDIERVLVVSVAPAALERLVTRAAQLHGCAAPIFVRSARRLGPVTTRYREPWRLGADRLVAAVGAHALVGARSVCVIDVGTAMTLDLLDPQGVHLGGVIVPGPELMVASLLADTAGIERRARGARRTQRAPRTPFARDTRSAIALGAAYAVAAAIDRVILEAGARLGRRPAVLLTGGAAAAIRPLLRASAVRLVPDLVLRGLAKLANSPLR